jgi:hypothetical protein
LIDLPPVDPGGTYGYADGLDQFCLGENLTFGTCGFAGIGNIHAVVTAVCAPPVQVMSDGEIELMDHAVTGFMPTDRSTDHGAALVTILDYWRDHGWAGDPTLVPLDRQAITLDQIAASIDATGTAYSWFQLPQTDGQFDLSDLAVRNGTPGVLAHCMTVIKASPGLFQVATWGGRRVVSEDWINMYWRGGYAVLHPLWTRPITRDLIA